MSPRNRSASASVKASSRSAPSVHRPVERLGGGRVLARASSGPRPCRRAPAPRGRPTVPPGRPAPARVRRSRWPTGSPSAAGRGRPRRAARRPRGSATVRSCGSRSSDACAASSRCSAAHEGCPLSISSVRDRAGAGRTRSRLGRLAYATSFSVACRSRQRASAPPPSSSTTISASSSCRSSSAVAAGSMTRELAEVERHEERRGAAGELAQAGWRGVQPGRDDAWTVGGSVAPAGDPSPSSRGSSMPVVSMMKKGLPPARSAISRRLDRRRCVRRRPAARGRSRPRSAAARAAA